MASFPIIVLPGLDGTDLLLQQFVELAPEPYTVEVVALPDDPTDDYNSLCAKISLKIVSFHSCHLIAESFSGPLGILLAHRHPDIIRRLTLVATFALPPTPSVARLLPWSLLFRCPLPSIAARYFFVGSNEPLVTALRNAVRNTSPLTLAKRMKCLMSVDVSGPLSELTCDVQYLRAREDRIVSKRSMDQIVKINPATVVHEIEGPHLILQTRPKLAWATILRGCDRQGLT
jgi:pimeloyl-ACP methyl ester carboxylesterase